MARIGALEWRHIVELWMLALSAESSFNTEAHYDLGVTKALTLLPWRPSLENHEVSPGTEDYHMRLRLNHMGVTIFRHYEASTDCGLTIGM
jgi:hypothetical protein